MDLFPVFDKLVAGDSNPGGVVRSKRDRIRRLVASEVSCNFSRICFSLNRVHLEIHFRLSRSYLQPTGKPETGTG